MMARRRIAGIDFMKCLCIMLIVMYHINHDFFDELYPGLNNALQAFRLPMYYFFSGLFFKRYYGFADFTRRKVNNILVPFVFFIVLAFVVRCLEYAVRLIIGAEPISLSPLQLVEPLYLRYWEYTAPLWFLLSLFWVNILFFALQQWMKPLWGILLGTVTFSLIGYWLGANKIVLPLMLDTSLVAMPYFVLGWCAKAFETGFEKKPSNKWSVWGCLMLLVVAWPVYRFSESMNLHSQLLPPYWKLYLLPFVAILALYFACRNLPQIPVLCHFGQYSLIILGTHPLLFLPIRSLLILRFGMVPGIKLTLTVFVFTMLLEWPVIWLLKTYAPRLTAQQPFFKYCWKIN